MSNQHTDSLKTTQRMPSFDLEVQLALCRTPQQRGITSTIFQIVDAVEFQGIPQHRLPPELVDTQEMPAMTNQELVFGEQSQETLE